MSQFNRYKATLKLKSLAMIPFDLTRENNLTPQRLEKFIAESCGYQLLYGTERVNEDTLLALAELAQEANVLAKMKKMQSGEIVNSIEGFPSENRPALHTALRAIFDTPVQAKAAADAARGARKEIDKLKSFIAEIDKSGRFTDILAIGIGGSDLGPKAHYLALRYLLKAERHVHFVSNIDPDELILTLRELDLKKTLVLIISKSGSTLETLTNEEILRKKFSAAGLDPKLHFASISCPGSALDKKNLYLETFYLWEWVGGRYSTTSMVGGVTLAFAYGMEVFLEFLRGAHAMDKAALQEEISQNIPLLGALLGVWNRNFLGFPALAVIPYSQALSRFAAHIQQVDMESNGKRIDRQGKPVDFETGPLIFGEPGTSAQHSFYQELHQGTTITPLEFIGYKDNQCGEDFIFSGTNSQEKLLANLFAQSIALATGKSSDNPNKVFPGNRPSHILLGKQLTPYALGALLAYFEHKIAFQGFIWGINSFDQEGVQLGKELAGRILQRFAAARGEQEAKSYPLGDAYLKFLDRK